jgi:tetratricopeptide (TPR) repeat protein
MMGRILRSSLWCGAILLGYAPMAFGQPAPDLPMEAPPAEAATPDASAESVTPSPVRTPPPVAKTIVQEAAELLQSGALEAAEAKASFAQTLPDQAADAHYELARVRVRQGRYSDAMGALDKSLSVEPTHVPSWLLRVRISRVLDAGEDAQRDLQRLAAKHPKNLGLKLVFAEAQIVSGAYQGAIRTATQVLKQAETSVAAMKILARAYRKLRQGPVAEAILTRALDLEQDPEAMCQFAELLLGRGELLRARMLLEDAIAREPGYVEALNNLGVVYIRVRNWEAALDVLGKAMVYAPAFAAAWLNLGTAQRGLGRFQDAETTWQKTLSVDPSVIDAWFNLGILYLDNTLSGRDREALLNDSIAAFKRYKEASLAAAGSEVDSYIAEGQLLLKQERERKAEALKALENPEEDDDVDDGDDARDDGDGDADNGADTGEDPDPEDGDEDSGDGTVEESSIRRAGLGRETAVAQGLP